MTELQIVGGGRMGEALLGGLLAGGFAPAAEIRVVEAHAGRRAELAERFAGLEVAEAPGPAAGTVIAVKPAQVPEVVAQVTAAGGGRVLSIAAGVTLAQLEAAAGPSVPIVRAMPNTPALVGAGASGIAGGAAAGPADLDWAESLLAAVGLVVRVSEAQLDAVTGLSGSGPAYVFLVAEALIEAGVLCGLPRDTSRDLAVRTLLGAARMLDETGEGPEALRAAVTSPGGTTAAGLRELERHGVRAAVLDAVAASADRAHQMAGPS